MEMGEKIQKLRLEKEMTLEQLGSLVGVGKSTVRKWENGMIANMRRDKIAKIADALGVSPGYLMGWDDSPNRTAASDHDIKEAGKKLASDAYFNRELRKYFDKLNDAGRQHVINYAKDLCETTKYTSFSDSNSESIA